MPDQQQTTVPKPPVPFEKVKQIADSFHELMALRDRERATQAKVIRWCVQELRSDPSTHRMRGHESYADVEKQRKENRRNRALALLYLDHLATKLEGMENVDPGPPIVR